MSIPTDELKRAKQSVFESLHEAIDIQCVYFPQYAYGIPVASWRFVLHEKEDWKMNTRWIILSQTLMWMAFITMFMVSRKMAPMWVFWAIIFAGIALAGWRLFRRPVR